MRCDVQRTGITFTTSLKTAPYSVLFLVQPAFSLLAFSAAADALITANLVNKRNDFNFRTLSVGRKDVASDLGLIISADYSLESNVAKAATDDANCDLILQTDLLVVCGGYRCALEENPILTSLLQSAVEARIAVGGLWNGCIPLAHAGLLNGYTVALHTDNHTWAKSAFTTLHVAEDTVVLDRDRYTAAGPNSSFDLMLMIIQRQATPETVKAIRTILRADTTTGNTQLEEFSQQANKKLPHRLEKAIVLLKNNLGARLQPESIAAHINLSTRATERLFTKYLGTTPARFYLELRLKRAYELLQQTDSPITEISDTCGFASAAHFSRSFRKQFGRSPREVRTSLVPLLR
ncbi:MAG: GlxA family transcriptional regulator [Granulosicoccus sp.]